MVIDFVHIIIISVITTEFNPILITITLILIFLNIDITINFLPLFLQHIIYLRLQIFLSWRRMRTISNTIIIMRFRLMRIFWFRSTDDRWSLWYHIRIIWGIQSKMFVLLLLVLLGDFKYIYTVIFLHYLCYYFV